MSLQDVGQALISLRAGGVIAYPTESVFGLGCDPNNEAALVKILALKGRDNAKGFIIIACELAQLTEYTNHSLSDLKSLLLAHCDVPTTWIVDAKPMLSPLLTGGRNTIAVRVTQHPIAASLCRHFAGAIVSTSANLSGQAPARSADEVRVQFPEQNNLSIDYIIDAAVGKLERPTRIIDARSHEILR